MHNVNYIRSPPIVRQWLTGQFFFEFLPVTLNQIDYETRHAWSSTSQLRSFKCDPVQ